MNDNLFHAMRDNNRSRTSINRRKLLATIGGGSTALVAGCAGDDAADDEGDGETEYPTQSITVNIPWGEGGGTDTVARGIEPGWSAELGVSLVIENLPGPAALRGIADTWLADPDGYTIGAMNVPTNPISVLIQEPTFVEEPTDLKDFEIVGSSIISSYVVTMDPGLEEEYGVSDFDDLVELYEDGELENFGIPGGVDPIAMILRDVVGIDIDSFIRYESAGEVFRANAAGEIPAGLAADSSAIAPIEGGELNAGVALYSEGSELIDVDSLTDLGYENIDFVGANFRMYGYPPGTPDEIVETGANALEAGLEHPDVVEWGEDFGQQPSYIEREEANQLWEDAFDELLENVDIEQLREDMA